MRRSEAALTKTVSATATTVPAGKRPARSPTTAVAASSTSTTRKPHEAAAASVHAPGVDIETTGEDASVRLPGVHIDTKGDKASVRIGSLHIDADDSDGSARITGSSPNGDDVTINAQGDAAEIRASGGGEATRTSWILTDNQASESGWRVVGYEARGPVGGPLVVATVRSRDRNRERALEDARDLVALNAGE